jgi:hypothetical protein
MKRIQLQLIKPALYVFIITTLNKKYYMNS